MSGRPITCCLVDASAPVSARSGASLEATRPQRCQAVSKGRYLPQSSLAQVGCAVGRRGVEPAGEAPTKASPFPAGGWEQAADVDCSHRSGKSRCCWSCMVGVHASLKTCMRLQATALPSEQAVVVCVPVG